MRFLLLSLSIFVLGISCSKDNPLKDTKQLIIGKWEIESSFCGICPVTSTNYAIGNGQILIFYKDGRFERLNNNAVAYSGNYELKESSLCAVANDDIELTTTENAALTDGIVKFNSGKLIFSTPSCVMDGGSTTYRRIP